MSEMEKQTMYLPMLSLKEMALRKSVAHFWSKSNVLALIAQFHLKKYSCGGPPLCRNTAEREVKKKISELGFPELLNRQMSLIVEPIGVEMYKWWKFIFRSCFHSSREIMEMHILKQLSWAIDWTSAGTIDYLKTAEKIVSLEMFDPVKRFRIACGHSLVGYLPKVWKELPEEYKNKYDENLLDNFILRGLFDHHLLEKYWAYVLKGQKYKLLEKISNLHDYMLESSMRRANKFSTEYFFKNLTNDEQRHYLSVDKFEELMVRDLFSGGRSSDVFLYFFHQMSHEQQIQIIGDYPQLVFNAFLNWPWHHLFLDKANLIWISKPEGSTYDHVLYSRMEAHIHSLDYYFPELFQEFFRQSPMTFRKCFVNEVCECRISLFSFFLIWEDKETANVILKNIDSEDRVRLVSCFKVFKALDKLLEQEKLHLLELCVKEAFPSQEGRERLKEIYRVYSIQNGGSKSGELSWLQFFESLEETDAVGLQKKSLENQKVTTAKRRRRGTNKRVGKRRGREKR